MKKRHALLFASVMLTGLSIGMPAQADPPHRHGHRVKSKHEYRYVYYPAQRVYYAPATGNWFWLSGGNWQVGASLPARYRGYGANDGVSLTLGSSRPYAQHVYVEEYYGRPWREQHRHKGKHKHQHKHDH